MTTTMEQIARNSGLVDDARLVMRIHRGYLMKDPYGVAYKQCESCTVSMKKRHDWPCELYRQAMVIESLAQTVARLMEYGDAVRTLMNLDAETTWGTVAYDFEHWVENHG